jgi:hypothetical protein
MARLDGLSLLVSFLLVDYLSHRVAGRTAVGA